MLVFQLHKCCFKIFHAFSISSLAFGLAFPCSGITITPLIVFPYPCFVNKNFLTIFKFIYDQSTDSLIITFLWLSWLRGVLLALFALQYLVIFVIRTLETVTDVILTSLISPKILYSLEIFCIFTVLILHLLFSFGFPS